MPVAGQVYQCDASAAERERVRILARDLEVAPDVLSSPDRKVRPLTCRISHDQSKRLDALTRRLRLLPGATTRLVIALGVDMIERAVEEGDK